MFLLDQCCWGIWDEGQKLEEIFSRERNMKAQLPTMQPKDPEEALCSVFWVAHSCVLGVAAQRAAERAP